MIDNVNLSPEETTIDIDESSAGVFSLRPQDLSTYIGQSSVKHQVDVLIESAKKRNACIDHVLIYGLPGLGKTSLAQVIANELGVNIVITSGPAIEKTGDVAALLSNLNENDILFIDEIHRLKPKIEEMFYTAMEDYAIDIILGKGPTAKSMRLELTPFTLIGATTKVNKMSSPLRDRFGCVLKLDFYEESEIQEIIVHNAEKMDLIISQEAAALIAHSSRRTPRIANRLLRRVRDFHIVNGDSEITLDVVVQTLTALQIDDLGLGKTDFKLLRAIHENFGNGPVGLSTLSAALNEDKDSVEDVYEPYLMQLGLLERTHRGRLLTTKGIEFVSEKLEQL
jgi:Holliday junction DNA helicase RuvB